MVDVFQALLPQGASLSKGGAATFTENDARGVGVLGSPMQTPASEDVSSSFKAILQYRVAPGKAPLAPTMPAEAQIAALSSTPLASEFSELPIADSHAQLLNSGYEITEITDDLVPEVVDSALLFSPLPQMPVNHEALGGEADATVGSQANINRFGLLRFYPSLEGGMAQGAVKLQGVEVSGALAASDSLSVDESPNIAFSRVFNGPAKELTGDQVSATSLNQGAAGRLENVGSLMSGMLGSGRAERLSTSRIVESLNGESSVSKVTEGAISTLVGRQSAELPSSSFTLQTAEAVNSPEAMKMSIRFGQPGWAEQLAERAANLAGQNIKQAEVQLNPQELGSIHIKISVSQEQAAVTFAAQNAQVREAIDQTLHRLREAFDGSGLELVQADVHDQQPGGEPNEGEEQGAGAQLQGGEEPDSEAVVVSATASGIDHFV